jgi:hypothetical protein
VRSVAHHAAALIADALGLYEVRVGAESGAVALIGGKAREAEQGKSAVAGTLGGAGSLGADGDDLLEAKIHQRRGSGVLTSSRRTSLAGIIGDVEQPVGKAGRKGGQERACQQRKIRRLCAGILVSLSKATSTFLISCWHPTMSTTLPPFLTCLRALRESKEL